MRWVLDTTKLDQFLRKHKITQIQMAEMSGVDGPEINRLCLGRRPRPSVLPIANIYMALKAILPDLNLQFEDLCLRKDGQG